MMLWSWEHSPVRNTLWGNDRGIGESSNLEVSSSLKQLIFVHPHTHKPTANRTTQSLSTLLRAYVHARGNFECWDIYALSQRSIRPCTNKSEWSIYSSIASSEPYGIRVHSQVRYKRLQHNYRWLEIYVHIFIQQDTPYIMEWFEFAKLYTRAENQSLAENIYIDLVEWLKFHTSVQSCSSVAVVYDNAVSYGL